MTAWRPAWLKQVARRARPLWRGVEAQHRVATMRLVDDLQEQELLEALLEESKPPLPADAGRAHWLLFTPFRYAPPWPSRFRRPHEAGAWYGADEPATVAAELAYWRWRFFMDSDGLRDGRVITELSFFRSRFDGAELDITQPPWSICRDTWRGDDYAACQALAAHLRGLEPPVQAIRYESARREGAACQVVFDVHALTLPNPVVQQTWTCKVTSERVLMSRDGESLQFDMA